MRRSALFAAIAAQAVMIVSAQPYYWVYPSSDAPKLDITQFSGYEPDQLAAACNGIPGCVAFNDDGWLKNSTSNIQPAVCNLYIQHDTPQPTPGPLSIWPKPTSVLNGSSSIFVQPTLSLSSNIVSTDLTNFFTWITSRLFIHPLPTAATAAIRNGGKVTMPKQVNIPFLGNLQINVANPNAPLQLYIDETYNLTIPADGTPATINANTLVGAYHALVTLAQLITWDFDNLVYRVDYLPLSISDVPRFAWRGMLIDTSRHFQPLASIFHIIDSLVLAKANVIHVHWVDWQAWPIESAAAPLAWEAAWSPNERYTLEDMAAVVAYGASKGVRVVPEFDTPGHAGSLCTGYPEVCPSYSCDMPLNPVSNATLPLIEGVLKEWSGNANRSGLFPDDFVHLGGDEVDETCWQDSTEVQAWMKMMNYTSTDQIYEYFVAQVDQMALSQSRFPVRWEEVWDHFGTGLNINTIIHVWLSKSTLANVTANGYRGILSDNDLWYLDHLTVTWQQMYDNDPLTGITNTTQQGLVLGGEGQMWGETADPSDEMATVWPRQAAILERLWSYNVITNSSDPTVQPRLEAFRCFMHRFGVGAAPVTNPTARDAPTGPGSCYLQ
jgi:hexosaminidase